MELPPLVFHKEDYIETLTGNRVSRKSVLCGSQNIRLSGKTVIKPGSIIRGDLANVNIGRFSLIGNNTVVRPSYKRFKAGIAFFPLTIGDYVMIEEDCVISAASIGSFVHIGKHSVISRRCVIKDCAVILPGSVVAPDTVIPPFTVFGGQPARFVEELPESFQEWHTQKSVAFFESIQMEARPATPTTTTTPLPQPATTSTTAMSPPDKTVPFISSPSKPQTPPLQPTTTSPLTPNDD